MTHWYRHLVSTTAELEGGLPLVVLKGGLKMHCRREVELAGAQGRLQAAVKGIHHPNWLGFPQWIARALGCGVIGWWPWLPSDGPFPGCRPVGV